MSNLENLQRIADRNGGNRAFGLSGYSESVNFITDRLKKHAETSTFYTQDFPGLFNIVESIDFTVSDMLCPIREQTMFINIWGRVHPIHE